MKTILTATFILIATGSLIGQANFYDSLKEIENEFQVPKPSFTKIVFIVENAYLESPVEISKANHQISLISNIAKTIAAKLKLNYEGSDYRSILLYASIFTALTDSLYISYNDELLYRQILAQYDFDDIFGANDWTKMFVSKLLFTGYGNCHSMPYLYKMICEELNIPCHLALAPNHIYIKHRAEKGGWYNVELTSASFPTDAWLMASGYISLEAVQNGIYLDTLSEKESIALCVIDLAQGYNHKYPDNDGTFVIQCCDLALKHFPKYVNAILLKAETRLKQLQAMQKQYGYAYLKEVTKLPEGKKYWDEMNSLYMQLYQLGYRQMPEQMYMEWLASLKTEKEKYTNKQVEQMNRN